MNTSEVWAAFGDRLRRYVRKHVRQEHDADDVLQEAVAKIHAGLDDLADPAKLEAWTFRVARRSIVDHHRRRRALSLDVEPAIEKDPENVTALVASWLPGMMEALPEKDREALRLTDVEGLPQRELAARLGLSLTGAKSRIQRARKRLQDTLLDCCDLELDRRGQALAYTPKNCACA